MKRERRFVRTLGTSFVLVASAACGNLFGNPLNCCGNFEVFAEALYLRPSTCSFDYVIEDPTFFDRPREAPFSPVPVGHEEGMCPDYEWGFRVGVGYIIDGGCRDMRVIYNRLCTNDRQTVDNIPNTTVLWPTYGPVELLDFNQGIEQQDVLINGQFSQGINACATNRVRVDWNAVDVEIASRQRRDCALWIRGHVGLEWTEICVRRDTNYKGSTVTTEEPLIGQNVFVAVQSRTRTWGVGARFGADLHYDILCGFGTVARAGAGLFSGETRHDSGAEVQLDQFLNIQGQKIVVSFAQEQMVADRSRCIVFPEFDVALGISYSWCCSTSFVFLCEVGYEWKTYLNVIDHSYYLDETSEANRAPVCDHFAFSGLYIRGLVEF